MSNIGLPPRRKAKPHVARPLDKPHYFVMSQDCPVNNGSLDDAGPSPLFPNNNQSNDADNFLYRSLPHDVST